MFKSLLGLADPKMWYAIGFLVLTIAGLSWQLDSALGDVALLESNLKTKQVQLDGCVEDKLEAESVAETNATNASDLADELKVCTDKSKANEKAAGESAREAQDLRTVLQRELKRRDSQRKIHYDEDQDCAAWAAMPVCPRIEQQLRKPTVNTQDSH